MATPTSFTPKQLWAPVQVPASDTVIYTSPASPGLGTRLQALLVVNTSAAPVSVRVTHGSMAAAQALAWDFSVPGDGLPYDLLADCRHGVVMDAADQLRAQAGAATSLTVHGYGVEMA